MVTPTKGWEKRMLDALGRASTEHAAALLPTRNMSLLYDSSLSGWGFARFCGAV